MQADDFDNETVSAANGIICFGSAAVSSDGICSENLKDPSRMKRTGELLRVCRRQLFKFLKTCPDYIGMLTQFEVTKSPNNQICNFDFEIQVHRLFPIYSELFPHFPPPLFFTENNLSTGISRTPRVRYPSLEMFLPSQHFFLVPTKKIISFPFQKHFMLTLTLTTFQSKQLISLLNQNSIRHQICMIRKNDSKKSNFSLAYFSSHPKKNYQF